MQTYGQYLVGIGFNPSGDPSVDMFKRRSAELIDELATIREQSTNPEVKRLCSLGITAYEEAALWAVKAVTKPERDLNDPDPEGTALQSEVDKKVT